MAYSLLALFIAFLPVALADFRVKFDVITTDGYSSQNTESGSFVLRVHEDWAPIGAAHFKKLVLKGHYDDTRFFRVIPSFMVRSLFVARTHKLL